MGKQNSKFKPAFFKNSKANFWKCGEGGHIIDIIPFKNKSGKLVHAFDVFLHHNLGENECQSAVCRKETFGLSCPICEYIEIRKNIEDIKNIHPRHLTLYNVICYDTEIEESKGIQVWLVPNFHMEHRLKKMARGKDCFERDIYDPSIFSDPKKGKSICFYVERPLGAPFQEFAGHSFENRDYIIDEEWLNDAYKLDELVPVPTYEEVNHLFWASGFMNKFSFTEIKNDLEEIKNEIKKLKKENKNEI